MKYTVPANIQILCAKPNLSNPEEQEAVKVEIVRYLKRYLNLKDGKNSLANVTGIIKEVFNCKGTVYPFERDIAGRMMRTRDYTMKESINEGDGKEVYVIAADRDWWNKYSVWVSFGLLVLGFIFGLFGEPIKNKIFTKPINKDTVLVKVLQQYQPQVPKSALPFVQRIPEPLKMDSFIKKP